MKKNEFSLSSIGVSNPEYCPIMNQLVHKEEDHGWRKCRTSTTFVCNHLLNHFVDSSFSVNLPEEENNESIDSPEEELMYVIVSFLITF